MQPVQFSVILPVHNGGEYVKSCVFSILSQTYRHFNLLVLENSSTDGTWEWLQTLQSSQLKIHRSDELLSIERNWERILNIKKNEFLTLIGHDDILAPDFLQTINDLIIKHPLASIYHTHFNYIDKHGTIIRPCKPMDEIQQSSEFLASLLTNQVDLMGTGFVMRSKDYDLIGGIPTNYPNLLFSDLVLYLELTRLSYKVTSFKNCFSFRLHQSTTSLSADAKLQQAFSKIVAYFVQLKKESEIFYEVIERYGPEFVNFYCKALSHRMLRKRRTTEHSTTLKQFVSMCVEYAHQLSPDSLFDPYKDITIRMGKIIDSNIISRGIFLLFKRIYSKPVV